MTLGEKPKYGSLEEKGDSVDCTAAREDYASCETEDDVGGNDEKCSNASKTLYRRHLVSDIPLRNCYKQG